MKGGKEKQQTLLLSHSQEGKRRQPLGEESLQSREERKGKQSAHFVIHPQLQALKFVSAPDALSQRLPASPANACIRNRLSRGRRCALSLPLSPASSRISYSRDPASPLLLLLLLETRWCQVCKRPREREKQSERRRRRREKERREKHYERLEARDEAAPARRDACCR